MEYLRNLMGSVDTAASFLVYVLIALLFVFGLVKCILPVARTRSTLRGAIRTIKNGDAKKSWQEETFLGRDLGQGKGYSETTAAEIDGEMRDIIDEAYETCRRTLTEHIDQLHALAKALMEREKLNEQEFNTIMAGGTLPPREGDEPEQTVQAAPAETAEQAQPAEAAEPAEQAETAQPLPETAAPETPDAQDPQN